MPWHKVVSSLLVYGIATALPHALHAAGQPTEVTAQAQVHFRGAKASEHHSNEGVVLWLTPVDVSLPPPVPGPSGNCPLLAQKNKQFVPHLLVVQVGSTVDFPNLDPFFHNVFSQFNGKRFDLGLYESGSNKTVRFDHEGVSYIFCNIHPEMSAVVIALSSPYVDISSQDGKIELHDVPSGSYEMHV